MLGLLDDALHGHVDMGRVRAGSRLRILATEDRLAGNFARYAELEAVEWFPPGASTSALRVYHLGASLPMNSSLNAKPQGSFFDGQGRQPVPGGWRAPVALGRISSRFNPRRVHPVLRVVMPHLGVDYAAPPGTPIYAAAPGSILSVGDGGPCGRMVQMRHAGGLVSVYCHLSRFASGLSAGARIEGRHVIGYVGQSGRATGPHLHFGVKRGDTFIDPQSLHLDGMRVVPPQDRERFARRREELDARLDAVALPPASGAVLATAGGDPSGATDPGSRGLGADDPLGVDGGSHAEEETIYDPLP
jgi:hypothetical protein